MNFEEMSEMGIPLTHVEENDNFAPWKKQATSRLLPLEQESNTRARSIVHGKRA